MKYPIRREKLGIHNKQVQNLPGFHIHVLCVLQMQVDAFKAKYVPSAVEVTSSWTDGGLSYGYGWKGQRGLVLGTLCHYPFKRDLQPPNGACRHLSRSASRA